MQKMAIQSFPCSVQTVNFVAIGCAAEHKLRKLLCNFGGSLHVFSGIEMSYSNPIVYEWNLLCTL